jgi:hypothetical protein
MKYHSILFLFLNFCLVLTSSLLSFSKTPSVSGSSDRRNPTWYLDPDQPITAISPQPPDEPLDCKKKMMDDSFSCLNVVDSTFHFKKTGGSKIVPLDKSSITSATSPTTAVFVEVEYYPKNSPKKRKRGWIREDALHREPPRPLYQAPPDPSFQSPPIQEDSHTCSSKKDPCVTQTPQPTDTLSEISEALVSPPEDSSHPIALDQTLESAVESIKGYLGHCPLTPSNNFPQDWFQKKNAKPHGRSQNFYDQKALSLLENQWKQTPESERPQIPDPQSPEKKKPVTKEDLINIDVLARTLYAEMHSCFQRGLQYPMAVAKIALNRSLSETSAYQRTRDQDSQSKEALAKVLLAPSQFSVWNYPQNRTDRNKTSLMTLCPTHDPYSSQNWKGEAPGDQDLFAWNQSVRIATETVLFQEQFMKRTEEVTHLYYTSGQTARIPNKTLVDRDVFIQDRLVHESKKKRTPSTCISLWE